MNIVPRVPAGELVGLQDPSYDGINKRLLVSWMGVGAQFRVLVKRILR